MTLSHLITYLSLAICFAQSRAGAIGAYDYAQRQRSEPANLRAGNGVGKEQIEPGAEVLKPVHAQSQPGKVARPSAPRARILLLGTFHFQDAGADDYKTKFSIDALSSRRQREIAQLLDSLARFTPTRICVEWPAERQAELDALYQRYLSGQFNLQANEIYQLGFRLAKRLGHHEVFAIDASQRWYDTNTSTEFLVQRAQEHKQLDLLERGPAWIAYFDEISERDDKLKTEISISDFLIYLNSPQKLRLTLGRYLVGHLEVGGEGDYTGADMRTAWYNRNLRIFSNIERIALKKNERVLVIIGQGHVPILRHLIENAPEYRLASVRDYLKPRVKLK